MWSQLLAVIEYFLDPRNQCTLRDRFGETADRPKLVTIIERSPKKGTHRLDDIRQRGTDAKVITYDDILEFRRSRLHFFYPAVKHGLMTLNNGTGKSGDHRHFHGFVY
jgi:hypothetical protein